MLAFRRRLSWEWRLLKDALFLPVKVMSGEAPGSRLQTGGEFRPRPKAFEPKPGGWRRGKGLKHLKRPGISTAAHFTVWVINNFVATACSQTAK